MNQFKISPKITNREVDSVDKYLKDISKYSLINAEKEIELSKRVKSGDQRAVDELVKANLRFVISVSKQYQNMGLSFEDLIAEGNVGLIKAAQKFDESKGFKFISYAVWWIRQSILKAIAEKSRVVYLPLNKINSITKINKAISEFESTNDRDPLPHEISDHLGIDIDEVDDYFRFSGRHVSMDTPINEEGDTMYDVYENSVESPDESLMMDSLKKNISTVLNTLPKREAEVLELHFGLNGSTPMALEEIAEMMDLTKERIRQIKTKALKKIKHTMRGQLLKASL